MSGYFMERFKVFDILHHEHLCQISIELAEVDCLTDLFEQLEKREIKIKFVALHQDKKQGYHISFCVEKSNLKTTQKILLHSVLKEENVHIFPDAGMIAIYGPHFGEKPGIIETMYNALSSQGVKILSISTTASTSFFIIPAWQVVKSLEILRQTFEIPQGKI
jgi:aspartokinase